MKEKDQPVKKGFLAKIRAVQVTASVLGFLCIIASMDEGYFEVLQKNSSAPAGMVKISGMTNQIWTDGKTEQAPIPFFSTISGILGTLTFPILVFWTIYLSEKKYGWAIFIIIALIQFITGKGFVPITVTIIIGLAAFIMNKPYDFWDGIFPAWMKKFLSKLWIFFAILFCVFYLAAFGMSKFGQELGITDKNLMMEMLWDASYILLGLFFLVIISSFAHDIEHKSDLEQVENGEN